MKKYGRVIERLIIIGLSLSCVIFGVLFFKGNFDRKAEQREYEELSKQVTVETHPQVEPLETLEKEILEVYQSPIDFDMLWELNQDVVAWIKIPGTPIDYPILYTDNNETYLKTDLEGNKSNSGAIYLDFESLPDFSGKHNIIYGHNMKNGSMFQSINAFKKEEFFKENRDIYLYFPDREVRLRTVAALYTDAGGDKRRTKFDTTQEFERYVDEMTKGCLFREMPKKAPERLYSFVTCSYEFPDARTILYAVEWDEQME